MKDVIMPEKQEQTLAQLRSPRAAAINGILFSLLSIYTMSQTQKIIRIDPANISQEWLKTNADTVSLILLLIPFMGITFLWFTGVLRDWSADVQDRFFSTVFFGSGILAMGMLFVWAAIFGALYGTYTKVGDRWVGSGVYYFGVTFMNSILSDFTLRMLGLYVSSVATLWAKSKIMPRWLIVITFIVAFIFIIFASTFIKTRYIFPGWVFLVSVYILIYKYHRTQSN